jgi:hypothetical protein
MPDDDAIQRKRERLAAEMYDRALVPGAQSPGRLARLVNAQLVSDLQNISRRIEAATSRSLAPESTPGCSRRQPLRAASSPLPPSLCNR